MAQFRWTLDCLRTGQRFLDPLGDPLRRRVRDRWTRDGTARYRGHQRRSIAVGKVQSIRQEVDGHAVRADLGPSLQIANGPSAQGGSLGQLFLR